MLYKYVYVSHKEIYTTENVQLQFSVLYSVSCSQAKKET